VCQDDAVDRSGGRNRNIIDDPVDRVAKEFETRDERDIEITVRKLCAKGGGMIERNRTWPAVNERTGVEIFDAADAERFQRERWLVCDDKSGRKSRAHASSVCTRRHLANARLRGRMPSKARKMRALPIYAQASSAASAADAGFSPFRAEADK